jgi:glycosyltransferase involved in cell wall biosynthesis
MQNPLVSIVMTAYASRPDYLSTAIQSALGQTWDNLEVIVSDDSPDQSLRVVVERFGDRRLRYRHNAPALGVARNHWACFREAQGEFVAVLNHDDWFAPTFVERLVAPLRENNEMALAFCDHWVVDANGKTLAEETEKTSGHWNRAGLSEGVHRPFVELLAGQTIPMVMGAVFRKRLLPEALPDHAGPAYDLWLTYLLCRTGLGAYYVRERLSSWRAHADNLTNRGGFDWSQGAAECWRAISADGRLAAIHHVAKRKAALAYYSCAVSSWVGGRGAACLACGWQSLKSLPTWRGLIACLLPVVPKRLAPRLTRRCA